MELVAAAKQVQELSCLGKLPIVGQVLGIENVLVSVWESLSELLDVLEHLVLLLLRLPLFGTHVVLAGLALHFQFRT